MLVWLNGRTLDARDASISPFDRGFLFGDGVYEVVRYFAGCAVDLNRHVERLRRSLEITRIVGFEPEDLPSIGRTLLGESSLEDAMLYLQVTRGVEIPRSHVPASPLRPTVFAYAAPAPSLDAMRGPEARPVRTAPDWRWRRGDIKAVSLLANVLAMMTAEDDGADEAILIDDGLVAEGARTNVFLVRDGAVVTPPLNERPAILHGVTRARTIETARDAGLDVEERPVRVEELRRADEIFITSTRRLIDAAVEVDGRPVGDGDVGPITRRLHEGLRDRVRREIDRPLESRR